MRRLVSPPFFKKHLDGTLVDCENPGQIMPKPEQAKVPALGFDEVMRRALTLKPEPPKKKKSAKRKK
jgi:hypothetical protein